jgi:hypothetical protein
MRAVAVAFLIAAADVASAASLRFQQNGPNDHDYGRQLVLPAAFGAGEFTLELWIRPDHTLPVGPTTPGTPAQLVNWSDESTAPYSGGGWWFPGNFLLDGHNNADFSAGTFSLQFYGGGRVRWLFGDGADPGPGSVWSVGAYPEAPEPPLLDGGWHQLTLVRRWSGASAARLELWIDGRLVDFESTPVRTNMRTYWDSWSGFPPGQQGWFWGAEKQAAIGVFPQYEDYKGLVDDVSFWSRAKTPPEIAGGWRAPAQPGQPGLVGLYAIGETGSAAAVCNTLAAGECMALVNMMPGYLSTNEAPRDAGAALRFHGNGAFEQNQVKIPIDAPAVPADVGEASFTLEFWIKANAGENTGPACTPGGDNWIHGDIVFDRDAYDNGDWGDFGLSLGAGRVVWGVAGQSSTGYVENTVCGSRVITDGAWHHVAAVKDAAAGRIRVYVDGQLDADGAGPNGDTTYRDGRPTGWPSSDPFLVIGAEKHFGATAWTGFAGWIDEIRLSSVVRYSANFTRPAAPFSTDAATRALYHFDEGAGSAVGDLSAAPGGPSTGVRLVGGSPAGPQWVVSDAPLGGTAQTVTVEWGLPADGVVEGDPPYRAPVVARTSNGAPLAAAATVQFATAAGTATATDFTSASGTVTFPAGSADGTFRQVSVTILDDTLDEPDTETFTIALSGAAGAVIGPTALHEVTISDDDPLPSLSVHDCVAVEGDAGTTPCAFPIFLSPASGRTVSVGYTTLANTASVGTDFLPASGVLTFAPGTQSLAVPVAIVGDTVPEPQEYLALVLSAPVSATLFSGASDGTIVDDDLAVEPAVELSHGARVRGDLDGGTADFFRLHQPPRASFEVVMDEAAGGAGLVLERVANDGTTVLQTASAVGTGGARSLRWANDLDVPLDFQMIRVRATGCGTACGPADAYRLRAYETTARLPRFNNTGGQATVLFLQNREAVPVDARAWFWGVAGMPLAMYEVTVPPRGLAVVNTSGLPSAQGQSGSVTITHDGGYGSLAGKAALVDPVSGFSFDAAAAPRER